MKLHDVFLEAFYYLNKQKSPVIEKLSWEIQGNTGNSDTFSFMEMVILLIRFKWFE